MRTVLQIKRNAHGKQRTALRAVTDFYSSTMRLYDSIADRETKPHPHTDRLGGKERLVDSVGYCLVDARSVVGHPNLETAGFPAGFNRNIAVAIDRIHRIRHQEIGRAHV